MKNEFGQVTDVDLLSFVTRPGAGLAKGRAIDELARRALLDHRLLDKVVSAIGLERTVGFKKELPLGWLGAVRLLESQDPIAIRALLKGMNEWSAADQEDLLHLWAPRDRFAPAVRTLMQEHTWVPKFEFDDPAAG